jgi:hypothetical protein
MLIYVIAIIIILFMLCNKTSEGLANTSTPPTEAIQTLASLYNKEKILASSFQSTGDVVAGGNVDVGGVIRLNQPGQPYISAPNGDLLLNSSPGRVWVVAKHGLEIGQGWKGSGDLIARGNVHIGGGDPEKPGGNVTIEKNLRLLGDFQYNPKCRIVETGKKDMGVQNTLEYLDRAFNDTTLNACKDWEWISGIKYTSGGNVHLKCCKIGS